MILPIYVPIIASAVSFILTFIYCKKNVNVNDLQDKDANSKRGGVQGLTILMIILIFLCGFSFMDVKRHDVGTGNIGLGIFIIGLLNVFIAYAYVLIASRKLKDYDVKQVEEKYFMRNVNYSLGSVLNFIAMLGGFFGLIGLLDYLANIKGFTSNEVIRILMVVLTFVLPIYLMVAIPGWVRKSIIRMYKKKAS